MELIKLNGLIQCCPENIEEVCAYIRAGNTLRNVASIEGMPKYGQLMQWLRNSPDFKREYQSALEYRSHDFHATAVDAFKRISDGTEPMPKETLEREKAVVDIGLKLAKMDNPAQYGDKMQISSTHKAIVIITGVPDNIGGDLGKALFGREGQLDNSSTATERESGLGYIGNPADTFTPGESKPGTGEGTDGDDGESDF
jgi:hypothetical protein